MNQTMPWMEQEEKKKSHDPERERWEDKNPS